jgi:hypothetical protein
MMKNDSSASQPLQVPSYIIVILSLLIAVTTITIGVLLPVISGPKTSDALINIFWGSIYGLGFLLTDLLPSVEPGLARFAIVAFGMLIWPVGIAYGVYRVVNAMMAYGNARLLALAALAFVASLMWNVEIGKVRNSFVYYLPLYTAFMER